MPNQSIWLLVSSFLFWLAQGLGTVAAFLGRLGHLAGMLCQALSALQQAPVTPLNLERPRVIGVVLGGLEPLSKQGGECAPGLGLFVLASPGRGISSAGLLIASECRPGC